MIVCITPNPAIDRTMLLQKLVPGEVHRAEHTIVAAGGKGLNVARAVRTLGNDPLCMGFAGGHAGHLLGDLAQQEGLTAHWTWTNAETRTCIILAAQGTDATVINDPGAEVTEKDWGRLVRDVRKLGKRADLVCISGSLPPKSSQIAFGKLLKILIASNKRVWVDTSGAALQTALNCAGINLKVNGVEIGAILGYEVHNLVTAKRALGDIRSRGISACIITLGADGAVLATDEGMWHAVLPKVEVVSTVGSGDSFLGGLVFALDRGLGWVEALCHASAAGTANALSVGGGRFSKNEFTNILDKTTVTTF